MKTYDIQWNLRLPSFFGASRLSLFIVFLLSGPILAQAQQVETAPAVSVEELEDLAAVMEDEAAREQLLSRIRILIATRKNTQVKPPVESAGAQLIATLSENVKETSRQLVATADALRDVPALFASVQDQVTNPKYRQQWFDLLIKVTLILFAGGLAERLVRLLLRRTRRTLEEREEADTLWVRLSLLAGRTVLDLVPIAAFAAAAYAVAPVVRPAPEVHVIALTLINAYLIVRCTLVVARMLLAPAVKTLRILPLTDVTANYLFIWVRRLVGFSVFGFFFAEAALLLGLPAGGHTALLRLLGLVITGLVVVLFLQNRTTVAAWIRGEGKAKRIGACAIASPTSGMFWRLFMRLPSSAFGCWA